MRRLAFALSALVLAACSGMHALDRDLTAMSEFLTLTGRVDVPDWAGQPIVVAVLKSPEVEGLPYDAVDFQQLSRPGSFRFIVPPRRSYRLVAFLDTNRDRQYQSTERIGTYRSFAAIEDDGASYSGLDIEVGDARGDAPIPAVRAPTAELRSLIIGEVESLDAPRFGPEIGRMGVWEPLTFMREHGAGLWMLEPYDPARTPVVFIHGIGGYPQEFRHVIARLDRTKFQAWVVQYPSGWALGDSAEYFRRGLDEMQATHGFERMCLVAHSMGGVVSRAMLNLQARDGGSSYIRLFVTIASPLGGHPAAAQGASMSPVVVPSWRDLVPDGEFIRRLYEHPLRADTRYVLLATTRDTIVPIESQLRAEAQEEAALIRAFAASHTGVLEDEALAQRLNAELLACRGEAPAP